MKGGWPQQHVWEGYYMGNCYCTFAHLCSILIRLPLLDNIALPKLLPTSYQPGRVGHNSDSCISSLQNYHRPMKFFFSAVNCV